jgi:hypothetical protein
MPRIMVGLLAAVGTAMSALAGLAHGDLVLVVIGDAAVATGLAAYLALPSKKPTDNLAKKKIEPGRRQHVVRSPDCCLDVGIALLSGNCRGLAGRH